MPQFLMPQAMPARSAVLSQTSLTARSVFLRPTEAVSFCPHDHSSPASSAFRHLISQPSRPAFSASMSSAPSIAKWAWFAPKPRMAPQGGLFV